MFFSIMFFPVLVFQCLFFKGCILPFFPAHDYKFFPICFFRCYIFFPGLYFLRLVFPECFFQNCIFPFFCAPCAYQFFPECFFQNCILLIFPAPYARMFFPELYFVHFFLHLVLISVFPELHFSDYAYISFQDVFSRIVFCSFFPASCAYQCFSKMFFPRTVFCQFFPAPLDFRLFPSCCSRDIVFFQKIFSVMLDLVVFPVQQHWFHRHLSIFP